MLILWDLNGTALDDMGVWYQATRKVFTAFGAHPPTIAEFFTELESGHFLEVYRNRGIAASADELNEVYVAAYLERIHHVHADPHFHPTVLALAKDGHVQGVVSSQISALVDPLRPQLGLDELPLVHWEYPVHDKQATFAVLCETTGVAASDAIYVGDTPSDARHAQRAGFHAVVYLNGYIPQELFPSLPTQTFIRSLDEVVELASILEAGSRG
jgi:phosphoglycolate phosphatase-like HAD superfamily hydrolase